MELFLDSVVSFFMMVGWQIVMFILCGIAFELAVEFIKATLYPVTKKKECPRWLGMLLGALITCVYLVMAYVANALFGDDGWYIPGGLVFLPVWFILFYFYQYKAMSFAKWLRNRMFPVLKDPNYNKPHKPKPVISGLSAEEAAALKKILDKEA